MKVLTKFAVLSLLLGVAFSLNAEEKTKKSQRIVEVLTANFSVKIDSGIIGMKIVDDSGNVVFSEKLVPFSGEGEMTFYFALSDKGGSTEDAESYRIVLHVGDEELTKIEDVKLTKGALDALRSPDSQMRSGSMDSDEPIDYCDSEVRTCKNAEDYKTVVKIALCGENFRMQHCLYK